MPILEAESAMLIARGGPVPAAPGILAAHGAVNILLACLLAVLLGF